MVIHFYIKYSTIPGETLRLRLYDKRMITEENFEMQFLNAEYWHLAIEEENLLTANILLYDCQLEKDGQLHSLFPLRRIDLRKINVKALEIYDEVEQPDSISEVFKTSAFRIWNQPKNKSAKKNADKNYTVAFNVFAPALPPGKVLCITGTGKKLRNWDTEKPLFLYRKAAHWSVKLNMAGERSVAFKYGIYDTVEGKIIQWEEGADRILHTTGKNTVTFLHQYARFNQESWKGTSLSLPLFSLRSEYDWGIGDFRSLKELVSWSASAGFKMLQLLPLLDTTVTRARKDSYPYSPVSAFAFHPLYLDVETLARKAGVDIDENIALRILAANKAPEVNYEEVFKLKEEVMRMIFEQEHLNFRDDFNWFEFFDLNRSWLVPYAVFSSLRDRFGTADFSKWGEYSEYSEEKASELADPSGDSYHSVAFYYFIQYHLHLQMKDVGELAAKNEIALKGDLPVGVARYSVETWMFPKLFNMNMSYGAPPDAFSDLGQNWGFPTYSWEEMKADGYSWWRRRMEHMSQYFQAVRVDHVIGFMRMFSIPASLSNPQLGYFDPFLPISESTLQREGINAAEFGLFGEDENADTIFIRTGSGIHFRLAMQNTQKFKSLPDWLREKLNRLYEEFFENQLELWTAAGEEKLQMLKKSSPMLLFAEDLGMVPPSVHGLLEKLRILCMRIERMPVGFGKKFGLTSEAPYLSAAITGTHDMATIREWWEKDRDTVQHYYNSVLGHHGIAPYFCEAWIMKEIVKNHLRSPAMWAEFPLQDILGMHEGLRRSNPAEERINDPSNANQVWNFRFHISIEHLNDQKQFNEHIASLIIDSGR